MTSYRFSVIDQPAGLGEHVAAWDELAACAIEPNPFYESWMLLPGIEAYGGDSPLRFVLAYAPGAGGAPLLCGFFPLERLASYRSVPLRHLRLWKHRHCYLARRCSGAAMRADACKPSSPGWRARATHR